MEEVRAFALSFTESLSKEALRCWMGEQLYRALGFLLSACGLLHIDACPIEAIDKRRFNKILGLKKWNIETRIAVAIGYRSEQDEYARKTKTRWPKEEVVLTV